MVPLVGARYSSSFDSGCSSLVVFGFKAIFTTGFDDGAAAAAGNDCGFATGGTTSAFFTTGAEGATEGAEARDFTSGTTYLDGYAGSGFGGEATLRMAELSI